MGLDDEGDLKKKTEDQAPPRIKPPLMHFKQKSRNNLYLLYVECVMQRTRQWVTSCVNVAKWHSFNISTDMAMLLGLCTGKSTGRSRKMVRA